MEKPLGTDGQHIVGRLTLTPDVLTQLDTCLKEIGDHGEVHLVVKNGHIRFIRSAKSMNMPSGGPDSVNAGG